MSKQYKPSKKFPWFCFDGDQNEYFSTEQEALDASVSAISYYLEDGWDEQVNSVTVGKVTHAAEKLNVISRPKTDANGFDKDDEHWPEFCNYKCDYECTPLK